MAAAMPPPADAPRVGVAMSGSVRTDPVQRVVKVRRD
jgi:hypothetical protein